MIYLDYAANHPVDEDVLAAFCETEACFAGNPNSVHPLGDMSKKRLEGAAVSIANELGIYPEELIFTSGATESNNLAIKGIAKEYRHLGQHIITTPLEHSSVQKSIQRLAGEGFTVDILNIKEDGTIDTDQLKSIIRKDTILVAVTAVDSELGTVQPVEEIKKIVSRYPSCHLHLDAVQAIGKITLDISGIDTVSIAPHKFGGINGCGILVKRSCIRLVPLIDGGESLTSYRSGTPALAMAVSMDVALKKAMSTMKEHYRYVDALSAYLRESLESIEGLKINSTDKAVPYIINVSVDGIKGTRVQKLLSEKGICISVKSACSSDGEPSKAVMAVSHDKRNALSSWRISISHLTTYHAIDVFIRELREIVRRKP